ncbi:MAG: tryptophan 7-halogenase [Phycisphaerales bacterium]|nr:MAG: tryptophan 7-halogenase [Phycisphaerales bacterium]
MSADLHDVAIIGAGPAGATAAIKLAQKEYRVALVDSESFPRGGSYLAWLNSRAAEVLSELGVATRSLLSRRIAGVTFSNADFSKKATPSFEKSPGYLIDRVKLDNALAEAATACGVDLLGGCAAHDLDLRESSTIVKLSDGRQVESKLLLLAPGRGSALIERASFPRISAEAMMWTAQVDASLETPLKDAKPRVTVVLGLDKQGSFGLLYELKDRIGVVINWAKDRQAAIPALAGLCKTAFTRDVLPMDLAGEAVRARAAASPASIALDLESHVGKHTLLIGDAGGFVSALSNEGIYPAMWSARIAVEVAEAALSSVHSQDALITFDSRWRIEMADYLRSPNTDNQFLLPLVFSNQPMADRMGMAFFAGENI